MQQMALFRGIFSDAHLVDIDLSAWDKRITLYVLADHVGRTADGRKPLFAVAFARVRRWDIEFMHLSHDHSIELEPDEHVQWQLDDFRIQFGDDGLEIALWGLPATPRMSIVCEGIDIWEVPLDIPDRLFPGWDRPSQGFVRPGFGAWPPRR